MMKNLENVPADVAHEILRFKASYKYYAEQVLRIRTKEGGKVPFRFNRMQQRLWDLTKQGIDQEKPVRLYLLKARQLGASTWTEGLGFWVIALNPLRDGLVVAHENDSASSILRMMHLFYSELPEWARPMQKISNRREIILANPHHPRDGRGPGLQSSVLVATADNENFGISRTLQFVHLSEVARYERVNANIRHSMKTMRQAVPRKPFTFVVYETTAQGLNYAKEIWDDTHNGITKVFISWVAGDEYTAEEPLVESELYAHRDSAYGDELNVRRHVIRELAFWYPRESRDNDWVAYESLKRLRWRRAMIDQEFEGDLSLFRQEYPVYPEEAFVTSGVSVFDTEKLSDMLAALDAAPETRPYVLRYDKPRRDFAVGNVDRTQPLDRYTRGFDLRLYDKPRRGKTYVIGADVAEGLEEGDYSAAQVLMVPDMVQVATAQLRIDSDDFAEYLNALGKIFNTAWIAVEVTGSGATTQLKLSKDLVYPRMYQRQVFDKQSRQYVKKWGWSTNRGNKPILIDMLRGALRDDLIVLLDVPTLNELGHYVQLKVREDGQPVYGAVQGEHDDLVTSLAVAWQMVVQLGVIGSNNRPQPPKHHAPPVGSLLWWERLLQNRERRTGELMGRDYGTPGFS